MADIIETFANGTVVERDFTEAELAQIKADKLADIKKEKELQAKAQAKATAEGKLAALGLTTDDLRALGL